MKGIILAGGSGTPAAPDHPGHQQAAHAGLRQADDLLPALHADDGRHPRGAGHHDARGPGRSSGGCSATAPQWGMSHRVRRAAAARGAGPGVRHRRRLHRRRQRRARPRRQHLLRRRPRHRRCAANTDVDGGHVFAYHVADPHGVRRRGVRRRRHGALDRGEAGAAQEPATPCPGSTSTTTTSSRSPATSSPARAASWRSPPSTRSTCAAGDLTVTVLDRGHRVARHRHLRVADAGRRVRARRSRSGRASRSAASRRSPGARAGIDDDQLRGARRAAGQERLRRLPARPARRGRRTR